MTGILTKPGSWLSPSSDLTYWERVALTRWGCYLTEIERHAVFKAIGLARGPKVALEIGCEGGRWSKLLLETNWSVICTDVHPELLELCQRRMPSARCVLVNPGDTQIPAETEGLGLLLCIEVPPVFGADWFSDEAHRVLAPGGILVCAAMNALSWRSLSHRLSALLPAQRRKNSSNYKAVYALRRSRFVQKGFSIVHEEGCCWFPFRRDSDSKWIPLSAKLEGWLGLRRLPSISPWVVFVAQKDSTTGRLAATDSFRP